MKKLIIKYFLPIIAIVMLLKMLLLPWGAHPYDFWTFVNTFERNFVYNWNVFEYWNKGNFLIILWYPFYSLYLAIISLLNHGTENVLILHFIMKLPFLFIDILSCYLVYKIIYNISGSKDKSVISSLIYFINPIIYYTYGIHGHYEILIPFSFLLMIYGLIKNNHWLIALGFVISFTTKYFIVIILPFILLYLIFNKKYRTIISAAVASVLMVILSYMHFIFDKPLINQAIGSVINLSSVSAGITEKLNVPALNIFSAFNFFINPKNPINNLDNNMLFGIASKGILVALFFIVIHLIIRVMIILKNKKYDLITFMVDLFLMLSYFLILISNFQAHYLSWLIVLLILIVPFINKLSVSLLTLSLVGFIYSYKNEIGPKTFFVDAVNVSNLTFLDKTSVGLMYAIGTIIVFIILSSIIIVLLPVKKQNSNFIKLHMFSSIIIWISVILFTITVFARSLGSLTPSKLYFSRENNYSKGRIVAQYKINSIDDKTINFDVDKGDVLVLNELFNNKDINPNDFISGILVNHNSNYSFKNFRFNECVLSDQRDLVISKDTYSLYEMPISCLTLNRNVIFLPLGTDINEKYIKNNAYLYVSNRPADRLFDGKQLVKIYILSIFAIISSLMFLFYLYKRFLRINNKA